MVKKRETVSNLVLILVIIASVLMIVSSVVSIVKDLKGPTISGNAASCVADIVNSVTLCREGLDCYDQRGGEVECDEDMCDELLDAMVRECFGTSARRS